MVAGEIDNDLFKILYSFVIIYNQSTRKTDLFKDSA